MKVRDFPEGYSLRLCNYYTHLCHSLTIILWSWHKHSKNLKTSRIRPFNFASRRAVAIWPVFFFFPFLFLTIAFFFFYLSDALRSLDTPWSFSTLIIVLLLRNKTMPVQILMASNTSNYNLHHMSVLSLSRQPSNFFFHFCAGTTELIHVRFKFLIIFRGGYFNKNNEYLVIFIIWVGVMKLCVI